MKFQALHAAGAARGEEAFRLDRDDKGDMESGGIEPSTRQMAQGGLR